MILSGLEVLAHVDQAEAPAAGVVLRALCNCLDSSCILYIRWQFRHQMQVVQPKHPVVSGCVWGGVGGGNEEWSSG